MENKKTNGRLPLIAIKGAAMMLVFMIVGALIMVVGSKRSEVEQQYVSYRMMVIGSVPKTSTELKAESDMIPTYKELATNAKIISETYNTLQKEGIKSLSWTEVKSSVKLTQKGKSLAVWASARTTDKKATIALVNAYTDAYAKIAPTLVHGMPKPQVMTGALGAAVDEDAPKPLSAKKAAVFGAALGFGLSVVVMLFIGFLNGLKTATKRK